MIATAGLALGWLRARTLPPVAKGPEKVVDCCNDEEEEEDVDDVDDDVAVAADGVDDL